MTRLQKQYPFMTNTVENHTIRGSTYHYSSFKGLHLPNEP